ncbi:alkaline phosphatase synthesis sensor protein PhoR [Clostridium tepidiprofundi DSM 19306]|uniref:histidine kinase n=1 Tax=Clostridium tepidiprofundi DSM 19306 TaxID=1121338 RepID=A0A151B3J6_9CLOT|nr:HAMP domain-containing sensor histidine kinase [Clostridium tepidiprofundi]KYH34360.1 alkaline phosphatase synthesis sensor protein PhoR [Clostridium tepidiprofundi DSM 19306]
MRKKGLFSKMVAVYIIIIAVTFVILAAFLSYWFQGYYYKQRKEQLITQTATISKIAMDYVNNVETPSQINERLKFMARYLKADIWLIDSSGYVYAVSSEKNKEYLRNQLFKDDIEKLKKNQIIEKKDIKSSEYDNYGHVMEVPIITENGDFIGAVVMNTPIFQIAEPLKKVYTIIWISVMLAMLPACIFIYWFSQKIILKPLNEINTTAKKISKGEVERRVYIDSDDEIGNLARTFNFMADSLEKVEQNRRRFISNVSHEIRSPITSIKGFIGGIIDGVIPKDKENYYLKMAYEETQRLTRLVNDLLDLSAIESGKFSLIIEEININEIIRLTVLKFENKIKEKRLKVDVCFDSDQLYVYGDRDRLIQVVTNLIDNAIKYSKHGGNIQINSKAKGKKVFISFYNDGNKISDEELNHIWERFYKIDKARTSKMSTGLGLSIVRGILTQLGEDIWVNNKDNGVCFTFTLTRAV